MNPVHLVNFNSPEKQRKFCPELWQNIDEQNVDELPHGMDGLCRYSIKNIVDVSAQQKTLSSDGGHWSKDSSTNWENFEGLVTFEHHCDKKDTFYVYEINDSRGNPDSAPYVFKTSRTKLKIANNMNKDGNNFLNKEFCFFLWQKETLHKFYDIDSKRLPPLVEKNKFL